MKYYYGYYTFNMRISYFFSCLMISVLFLCCDKQDASTPDYFISATNNGVYTNYKYGVSASISKYDGNKSAGVFTAKNDSAAITINISSQTALNTATTYSSGSASDNAKIIYNINGHQQTSDDAGIANVKVNFTSITTNSVEGNFSGTVTNKNRDSATTIINGKFLLPD